MSKNALFFGPGSVSGPSRNNVGSLGEKQSISHKQQKRVRGRYLGKRVKKKSSAGYVRKNVF